jgi:HEPN domain-containing protein
LCVEKAVKSILICFGAFERRHEVSALLESVAKKRNLLKGDLELLVSIAADMEEHIVVSRYPGLSGEDLWIPCEKYNEKDGCIYLDKAQKSFTIATKFLEKWLK